jgi:multiple sugar transport system permease protein
MSTASTAADAAQPKKASPTTRFRKWISGDRVFPWALVLPAALLLLILAIGPTLYVFVLAFLKYTPGQPIQFAGLNNFIRAFKTDRFWRGLYVTAWFVFVSIGIQLFIGFTTALSLQRVHRRVRQITMTLMLIPMMIAPTVVGVLWKMIYKARYGAMNYFLEQIGIAGPDWLADKSAALAGLLIADIWEWTPFMTILLLAGLQSLSREIYEASYVDGSTTFQAFKNMTLPLMRPFIFLAVFLRMVDALKTFDLIFGITRGGPGDFTESIAWYTYKVGFTYFELGYAAAISVIQLLIIIVLGRVLLNQLGRVREESRA